MRICYHILAIGLGWWGAAALQADIFFLTNGGRIEGELLNPDESPRRQFHLQTSAGKLTLAGEQVDRIVAKSDMEKRYEEFIATLPDTVDAHLDAAGRCEQAGLSEQREYHLDQVLRLDPNHEPTRYALGYSRVGGVWAKQEDLMRERGYVRYGNAWRLPQEVELEEAAAAAEKETVEWRKRIRMWREWIVKNRDRALDGRNEILRIRDPNAVQALLEGLNRDKEPQLMRLLYIEPLGEIGGSDVLVTFVKLVLEDRDGKVRERCLDKLSRSGSKAAVRQFIRALKHDENVVVQRAAIALERMKDPEATLPLIEALITEHKQVIGGSGITPSFSGDGGAGLSMGGGPKVVKIKVQNDAVRHALAVLHPGVHFGYDQTAWRTWYIQMNRPKGIVSLRRDP